LIIRSTCEWQHWRVVPWPKKVIADSDFINKNRFSLENDYENRYKCD
jgi:hypothetical protein